MPATDTTTIESSRFGTLQVAAEQVIRVPAWPDRPGGLALCAARPQLPVLDPRPFFPSFELSLSEEDRERIGDPDPTAAQLYVTLRAASDPADSLPIAPE
jgi:hypothetical protein